MKESLVIGLLQNISILLVLNLIYDYSWIPYENRRSSFNSILNGFIIGIIAIVLMMTRWVYIPGIVFDTRSIMLSIAGLFFGAIPTIIGMLIAATYRFILGGEGVFMGIAVIVTSGTIGIIWKKFRPSWKQKYYILELLAIGILVHAIMLLCTILLPPDKILSTLRAIAIPVIFIYPAGTVLLGILMVKQYNNWQNRKIKDKLLESERRFTELFKNVNLFSIILDTKSNILFSNQYLSDITGYTQKELIGKNWFDIFIDSKDKESIMQIFNSILKEDQSAVYYENQIATKNREMLYVSWNNTILRAENNEIIGTASIGENITARKATEEQMLQFANILKASLNEIYIFDADNLYFKYVNYGALQNLGYTQEQILTMTPLDITPDYTLDSFNTLIHPLKTHKESIIVFECRNRRSNRTFYPVEVHLQLFEYASGNIFLAVIQDISNRKNSENLLIMAKEKAEESDKLKSAFLANMSHEIRTPMNGIIGFSDLISRENLSAETRKNYSEIIKFSTDRLLRLLTDIIDYSKIEAGLIEINKQSFNLNQLIEEIIKDKESSLLKDNKKKLEFRFVKNLKNSKATIIADESRLKQVLYNLMDNAVKFTKEGFIEIGYRMINNKTLEIYIKDTGIGMLKDEQLHIFEKFRQADEFATREHDGAGLGLSIAKGLVMVLGGNIVVKSEKNKGSVFRFTIEIDKQEKNITEFYDSTDIQKLTYSGKILIVEDDLMNRLYFKEIFSETGANIEFAEYGEESVAIIKNHPEIKIVLMDMKLPDIHGLEAIKRIRQIEPDIRVIAQTAFAMDGDKEKFLMQGCDDYINKPINPNILFGKINFLMNTSI